MATSKSIRLKEIMEERNCSYSTARYYYAKETGAITVNDATNRKDLTLDILKNEWHITDVSEDGSVIKQRIGKDEYGKDGIINLKIYKFKSAKYKTVKLFKDKYVYVHRIVYVWYHGTQPAGYAVDHIDNDKLNNNKDNLVLKTIGENAAEEVCKRVAWKNQYTKDLTEEERLELYNAKKAKEEAKAIKDADNNFVTVLRWKEAVAAYKLVISKLKNK